MVEIGILSHDGIPSDTSRINDSHIEDILKNINKHYCFTTIATMKVGLYNVLHILAIQRLSKPADHIRYIWRPVQYNIDKIESCRI